MELTDQVALISGGTAGIGLAREGSSVIITGSTLHADGGGTAI